MKNKLLGMIALVVVVGGVSFYGGMKYGQSSSVSNRAGNGNSNFANLTPEERQQRIQQFGAGGGARRMGGANGGFIVGEIIGKDDKSVTVKMVDGSSKIIFFSASTKVVKSTDGSLTDLLVGKDISVNGTANQDGSVSAQTIQIRSVILPTLPINNQPK